MAKKVLVVAPTTEARAKARMDIKERWGAGTDIRTAGFAHAVGVCKEIAPCLVVLCPGAGCPVVYDEIKKQIPGQQVLRVGYDKLPAEI